MCTTSKLKSFRIDDILNNNKTNNKTTVKCDVNKNKHSNINESHNKNILQYNEKIFDHVKLNNSCTTNKIELSNDCCNLMVPSYKYDVCNIGDTRKRLYYNDNIINDVIARNYLATSNIYRSFNYPYNMEQSIPYNMWSSYIPMLGKRKGGQVRFTSHQTNSLERRFTSNKYLNPEDRRLLATQLKLSDRQVKTWFQNRRAKWRRANNCTNSDGEVISDDDAIIDSIDE